MAHAYELHVTVTAACLCCHAPRSFVFASPSDQVVCAQCVHHLGSDKSQRRDTEHVAMWADLYADQRVNHQAEVERLRAEAVVVTDTVAALTTEVAQLTAVIAGEFATGGVRDLLENDVVRRADRATELANRRNDRTMTALWRLERLHHTNTGTIGACACGKLLTQCPEFAALEPESQALADWERKNLALASEGKRHALPREHPALATAHESRRR